MHDSIATLYKESIRFGLRNHDQLVIKTKFIECSAATALLNYRVRLRDSRLAWVEQSSQFSRRYR